MSAAGVGFALIGAAAGAIYYRWRNRTNDAPTESASTAPSRAPWTQPVTGPWGGDLIKLQAAACSCAASFAEAADGEVAGCMWSVQYPGIPYPPIDQDHQSLHDAWTMLVTEVGRVRATGACAAPAPKPAPIPTPDELPMKAWFSPSPWPGHFYQTQDGDVFLGDDGIVADALARATYETAIAFGRSEADARTIAAIVSSDEGNRLAYLQQGIQCARFNDQLYGTYGFGPKAMPGPHGRAIRLIARHAPNYDRIMQGLAPQRVIPLGTPADQGTGSAVGNGQARELLWLRPLHPVALLDLERHSQVVVDGLVWEDGSPTDMPPPIIAQLGIEGGSPMVSWGCS